MWNVQSLLFVDRVCVCVYDIELKYRNVKFHMIVDLLHYLSALHSVYIWYVTRLNSGIIVRTVDKKQRQVISRR